MVASRAFVQIVPGSRQLRANRKREEGGKEKEEGGKEEREVGGGRKSCCAQMKITTRKKGLQKSACRPPLAEIRSETLNFNKFLNPEISISAEMAFSIHK